MGIYDKQPAPPIELSNPEDVRMAEILRNLRTVARNPSVGIERERAIRRLGDYGLFCTG
jgi:hypothetical protein